MQVTAEIRWFWSTSQDELKVWFCDGNIHDFPPGGGGIRVDSYLQDAKQPELGLKHRGGRRGVEIKGLVSVTIDGCNKKPFGGDIEVWSKWTSHSLVLDTTKTISTEKQRWLRRFDTTGDAPIELRVNEKEVSQHMPEKGCSIEFTRVRFIDLETHEPLPDQEVWWTLSFESFGSLDSISESLLITIEEMVRRNPPAFEKSLRASYPAWLIKHAPKPLLLQSN